MISDGERERARARRVAAVCARAHAAGREAMARGDFVLARAAFRWARRADPGNPVYIHAEAVLAERAGNLYEAERLFLRVADLAVRAFGEGDHRSAAVRERLVRLYLRMGRREQARRLAGEIVAGLDRNAVRCAGTAALARIAGLCLAAGRPDDAVTIYREAKAWRRAALGHGHPAVAGCGAAIDALAAVRTRAPVAPAAAPIPDGPRVGPRPRSPGGAVPELPDTPSRPPA